MIKGWYTKHEDKWHQIEDVKDTGKPAHEEGGGNIVKLKGKDDWVHASKLSGMEPKEPTEKYDRVDVEADGKKELDYGKEELDKKWRKLKKAVLDNTSSIMPIEDQEFHDDEDGEQDSEENDDISSEDEAPAEQSQPEMDEQEEQQPDEQPSPEEIEQMLREEGYSDAEIAHIIHGHIMPEATIDDIKMGAEQEMSDHKMKHQQRMDELDYNLATHEHETNGLDKDHKQRMLDLEYEYAKKEKEMELKHKEKELSLKLEHQKVKAEQKVKEAKMKDTGKSRSMDAAKTSQKERAGK